MNVTSDMVIQLQADPARGARLADAPERVPAAVEEMLRVTPLGHAGRPRVATEDVELARGTVRAGEAVLVSVVAANRDPAVFDPPEHGSNMSCLSGKLVDVDDDLDAALAAAGPRLRALRRRRETTLTELSATTGISTSTLSRLESGSRRPTLELLLPLARAHGVTLDELVGAPPTGDPRVNLRPVSSDGMTMLPLTRRAGGIQAYKLIIPRRPGEPDPRVHEGYEWLYVLDGRLRLVLGEHDVVLTPGEAAEFDTRTPHWFGPAGDTPVEILSLFGKQGERAHLRARPR